MQLSNWLRDRPIVRQSDMHWWVERERTVPDKQRLRITWYLRRRLPGVWVGVYEDHDRGGSTNRDGPSYGHQVRRRCLVYRNQPTC